MPTSTFSSFAQTILDTQWTYFWGYSASSYWTNASGTSVYIAPAYFLSYSGAAFAFLVSLIGA